MSRLIEESELADSRECPLVEGKRLVQHIVPRTADVGGIPVSRVLPSRHRRVIGPWCFLDHAGPSVFADDAPGLRVGPHPHIGLQTFTWMIEGQVLHRDSLGFEQLVRPGEVNLMTAGRGISHTEESAPGESRLHAAQLWIALPKAFSNTQPRFDHYTDLPCWREQGVQLTLLTGAFAGQEAATLSFSPLVGFELLAEEAAELTLPLDPNFEYGLSPLEGDLSIEGHAFATDELAYLGCGRDRVALSLSAKGRVILVGGEPLKDDILVWWNFVGHSKDEIAQAQRDWENQSPRFGEIRGFDGPRLMPPPLPAGLKRL